MKPWFAEIYDIINHKKILNTESLKNIQMNKVY